MLISPRLAFKESIARIESTKARKSLIRDEICPTDSSGSFFKYAGPWTSTRSNCARCTAKSSSSASVLAGLRFAADGEMRLRFQGSKKTDQRRGQNTRQRLSYQIAERTSIHMSMRCQNVRTKQNTHELEIINI